MKRAFGICLFILAATLSGFAQGKGVDRQNERIRDAAKGRTPGVNGTKQDVGAGRGIDFGSGRTPAVVLLPNPYRFSIRRDEVVQAVEAVMRERKLVLDVATSKLDAGLLVSQPFTFSRGVVTTLPELNRYAANFDSSRSGWTRGRYTLVVEVQPIDGANTNVSVNARIQGRIGSALGSEWIALESSGAAEQEFLRGLATRLGTIDTPQVNR